MSAPTEGDAPRPPRRLPKFTWVVAVAVVLLAVGTTLRLMIAAQHVDSPGIDENEVVEQAVAFMGGDLRFYFLKYGPLTMYALAGIYHVAALLHGATPLEYASRVFFEGNEHYRIARFYVVGWLSILAVCAFLGVRRHSGTGPALLALALLAFPVVEVLSPGARIDIPQGAFQGLALLALCEVIGTGRLRWWIAAGVCAGLGIATKPLPGLLVAPCFIAAAWFASGAPGAVPRRWPARLLGTVGSKGLWIAALACLACVALGNPTVLDLGTFIQNQRDAVALHSGNALSARAEISDSIQKLRLPFLVAGAGSAALVLLRRDARGLTFLLFIAVYLAALWGRASRDYFLVAPAVAACLLIARGWALLGELSALAGARRWAPVAWVPAAALIVAWPAQAAWAHSMKPSPLTQAREWIYEHVPSGTRIFHAGMRPSGPLLVATDEKLAASWGDHFDYGRHKYPFLKKAFHAGFERYMQSDKPRYRISAYDNIPQKRGTKRMPRWLTDKLVRRVQKDGARYIIVAGFREKSYRDLGYRWFGEAVLEAEFRRIAIFRVPEPGPVVQTSAPAPAPAPPAP